MFTDSFPNLNSVDKVCMQDYRALRARRGDREHPLDQPYATGAQKEYVPQHEIEARITLEHALRLVSVQSPMICDEY